MRGKGRGREEKGKEGRGAEERRGGERGENVEEFWRQQSCK